MRRLPMREGTHWCIVACPSRLPLFYFHTSASCQVDFTWTQFGVSSQRSWSHVGKLSAVDQRHGAHLTQRHGPRQGTSWGWPGAGSQVETCVLTTHALVFPGKGECPHGLWWLLTDNTWCVCLQFTKSLHPDLSISPHNT